MKKAFFVVVLLIAALLVLTINALADNLTLVCHKENGKGNAEMWKWVNENALPAHLRHGDTVWSPIFTKCGDTVIETVYPTQTSTPVVDIIPTPTCTPVCPGCPEPEPLNLFAKIFLPLISNACAHGWPWCSIP